MKRHLIVLAAVMLLITLSACSNEAMDKTESAMENMSDKLSSGVSDMVGSASSAMSQPTNADSTIIADRATDDPTDGDFGEPNVNDYDDNDKDVAGDEHEQDNFLENPTDSE